MNHIWVSITTNLVILSRLALAYQDERDLPKGTPSVSYLVQRALHPHGIEGINFNRRRASACYHTTEQYDEIAEWRRGISSTCTKLNQLKLILFTP